VVAVAEVPTVGKELTVSVLVAVAVQPCALVPVTVYVFASVTINEAPTPPPGCHVYELAPLAVIVALLPAQMVADAGTILVVTVGVGCMRITKVCALVQLFA
jgi:hypothetical protein